MTLLLGEVVEGVNDSNGGERMCYILDREVVAEKE